MKTLKFKHTILVTSTLSLASCLMALSEAKALIITEIMYDPYSEYNGDYGWIELYNESSTDIDLSDYIFASDYVNPNGPACFDVFDTNCVTENELQIMQNSSIPLTNPIISAGSAAVIYGSVTRDPQNDWGNGGLAPFSSIWNPDSTRDINFIPVFFPEAVSAQHVPFFPIFYRENLRGGKMSFGLWKSQDWDQSQNSENDTFELDFSKAALEFTFENPNIFAGSAFPEPNNSSSIYLTDLSANPNDGSNWALSNVGVDGAYAVEPNTIWHIEPPEQDVKKDVGSPGYVPTNVPEPLTILGSITALGFGLLFKRK